MAREYSAGAVIFRKEGNQICYLLLHYPSGMRSKTSYWDFPKGHIEQAEKEKDTVLREVREETGLVGIKFVEGFREVIQYYFKVQGRTVFKTVIFYLAESTKSEVKISYEHTGYAWLLYEEALRELKFANAKNILKKAHEFLSKKK